MRAGAPGDAGAGVGHGRPAEGAPLRVLFFMRHPLLNYRNFESTLRLLAERGHEVHVAYDVLGDEGETEPIERLAAELPGLSYGRGPRRSKRDPLMRLEQTLGLAADYLRYFEPEYADAPKLRERYESRVTPIVRRATRAPLIGTRRGLRWLRRALLWAGRSLPVRPEVDAFLREQAPDVVLLTPLVRLGSPQGGYIRAARALGLRTGLLVHSWDNLTNKGLIRDMPDFVAVWNELQRDEAVDLHGVPSERVLVTGAPTYDQWFDWRPSRDREAFCAEVGLPAGRPYLLYLCSSSFIAPHEAGYVERWVRGLREASDPRLREVGVLVRPHWKNVEDWLEVDFSSLGNVVVWPRLGANPLDLRSRSDFFDSMYHSAAIVGVNTSALIESAIVGRAVHTYLAPEFRDTQEGVPHFQHLARSDGGVLRVAESPAGHLEQLSEALAGDDRHAEARRGFIASFVRPLGLDTPATPTLVDAVEDAARARPPAPRRPSPAARMLRGALAVALLGAELRDYGGLMSPRQALLGHVARVIGARQGAASVRPKAYDVASGEDPRIAEHDALVHHRSKHFVEVDQPLVLVSQIDRSGGTLLSQLFDDHPQLHAHPYELHIGHPKKYHWPALDLDASPEEWFDVLREPPAERAFLEGYRKVAQPNAPPEDVETFPFVFPPLVQRGVFLALCEHRRPRSAREILDRYMTSYFNAWLDNRNLRGDEKRWVTAFAARVSNEEDSVAGLFDVYPDGRLVSIVRDPRSWYASARGVRDLVGTKSKERKYGTVEAGVEVWRRGTEALLRNREHHGEKVILLSFDELVVDTESTMRRLAELLGIEFHPTLTEPTFNGRPIKADSSFAVASHGVISGPLTRWREKLSAEEIDYVEREALPLYERILEQAMPGAQMERAERPAP